MPASSQNSGTEPRSRQADGVVSVATQPATTGPQARQEQNQYSFDILRFPEGIGITNEIPKLLHWIKFTPCIQQKSEYKVETTNEPSTADVNRSGGLGAGSANPLSGEQLIGAGAALGALVAAEALYDAAKGAFEATGKNAAQQAAAAGQKALAGAVVGGIGAAVSVGIVSAINLSRKTRRAAASICLYMPDTVTQQLVNDYDAISLTQALGKTGLAAAAGSGLIEKAKDVITGQGMLKAGLGGGGVGPGGALAEVAGLAAEKTGNFGAGIGDILLFSAGVAQNPQVEILFKNIQNREFVFDFKFVPKNERDAFTIRKIVQAFRFFAAPEIPTSGGGRYFIPPSEFDIEFMLGSDSNKNLPKLSTCVLQGIDVNYGSAGQWTAFKDGMPVEISMQLRFKEVEIIHKKLIEQGY